MSVPTLLPLTRLEDPVRLLSTRTPHLERSMGQALTPPSPCSVDDIVLRFKSDAAFAAALSGPATPDIENKAHIIVSEIGLLNAQHGERLAELVRKLRALGASEDAVFLAQAYYSACCCPDPAPPGLLPSYTLDAARRVRQLAP